MKATKVLAPLKPEAGTFVFFGETQSKLGPALAAWIGPKLIFLGLTSNVRILQSFLARRFPNWSQKKADPAKLKQLQNYLDAAIHDDTTPLPWPVLLAGTSFEQLVWNEMMALPPKTFTTYKKIAQAIGNPKGSRAVGGAVGRNPISVAIPCHRVITSSGDLGGYAWGIDVKKALIEQQNGQ